MAVYNSNGSENVHMDKAISKEPRKKQAVKAAKAAKATKKKEK